MADECLARAGVGQASKEKLAEAAARAEANGFPHGVSARAASGMTGEQLASAFRNKTLLMSICCQKLMEFCPVPSPFSEEIILNWYDGPLEGIVRCGDCSREYYFRDLAENEESGMRVYGLFDLPIGTLERVKRLLPPKYPIWEFASASAKQAAEKAIQKLRDEARKLAWVFATKDFKEILACRSGVEMENGEVIDWVRFVFDTATPVEV